MAGLSLRNIYKIYPARGKAKKKLFGKKKGESLPEPPKNFVAVKDFSMEIEDGEFIVFVGPSGCGKSTTLRMIAGLEEISEGELYIGDKFMNYVMPKDRDIAMVFQNYALYPHMTAYENIAFGLKIRKIPKEKLDENGNPIRAIDIKKVKEQEKRLKKIEKLLGRVEDESLKDDLLREKEKSEKQLEYFKTTPLPVYTYVHVPKDIIEQKVAWAAKILGVESLLERKPKEMSGGQRQRIALGRAMVRDPKVFLLDEPLSNLDAKLRTSMRSEIVKLHDTLKTTFIYVTHDQIEAMTMGTRIVVMKDGVVQQIDTPQNLYDHPCNKFVAGFIGSPQMNMITADAVEEDGEICLRFAGHRIVMNQDRAQALKQGGYVGGKVVLGIRPSDIHGDPDSLQKFSKSCFDVQVRVYEMLGAESLAYFDIEEAGWVASLSASAKVAVGDTIRLAMDTSKIHIFDNTTEKTIVD